MFLMQTDIEFPTFFFSASTPDWEHCINFQEVTKSLAGIEMKNTLSSMQMKSSEILGLIQSSGKTTFAFHVYRSMLEAARGEKPRTGRSKHALQAQ